MPLDTGLGMIGLTPPPPLRIQAHTVTLVQPKTKFPILNAKAPPRLTMAYSIVGITFVSQGPVISFYTIESNAKYQYYPDSLKLLQLNPA